MLMPKKLLPTFLLVLSCYLLIEAGTYFLMKGNRLHGDFPTFSWSHMGTNFTQDVPEAWATWHEPDSSYRHVRPCFDVTYHFNSEGMRDRPRSREASAPRVIVLGDSFVEGWGVKEEDRFTNLLEASSGKEFLDFGSSGSFGPIQYYLLYENFAKQFSHDEVLALILPINDFDDDNYEMWAEEGRRRPFWVGQAPQLALKYSEARDHPWSPLHQFFKEFSYFYNSADNVVHALPFIWNAQTRGVQSRFYDFTEVEWQRMLYSLQKLREASAGKKLSIALIPLMPDLQRYAKEGKSPLASKLEAWAKDRDVTVIDMMPWFHDHEKSWETYSHSCDSHWQAHGHRVAFELLKNYF